MNSGKVLFSWTTQLFFCIVNFLVTAVSLIIFKCICQVICWCLWLSATLEVFSIMSEINAHKQYVTYSNCFHFTGEIRSDPLSILVKFFRLLTLFLQKFSNFLPGNLQFRRLGRFDANEFWKNTFFDNNNKS